MVFIVLFFFKDGFDLYLLINVTICWTWQRPTHLSTFDPKILSKRSFCRLFFPLWAKRRRLSGLWLKFRRYHGDIMAMVHRTLRRHHHLHPHECSWRGFLAGGVQSWLDNGNKAKHCLPRLSSPNLTPVWCLHSSSVDMNRRQHLY